MKKTVLLLIAMFMAMTSFAQMANLKNTSPKPTLMPAISVPMVLTRSPTMRQQSRLQRTTLSWASQLLRQCASG